MNPATIDFIQSHQPALESGEYRVSVNQTLDDTGTKISSQQYETSKTFFIAGERFHILPEHIKSVFPPTHSLGEHSNVFPHIMLSRNTLPWERETISDDMETPWLGLLVIHQDEESETNISVVTFGDLKTATTASPYFPGISAPEPGQTDDLKVAVLDIKKSLLAQILPDKQALNFLSHIRQGKDDQGNVVGEDLAVLIANRLPQKGATNTVHLVSLENRYQLDDSFNYQGADPNNNDMIRLVKLHSWSFTSTEHFKVSEIFIEKASDLPVAIKTKLRIIKDKEFFTEADFITSLTSEAHFTAQELIDHQTTIFNDFAYGDFAGVLKHLDRKTSTLRLPDVENAEETNSYLGMGFYPLPHKLRQGTQTVSWYHGPLSPLSNEETVNFPVKSSDELLRYYQANGMLDVSYAAAWELGRLLALQNTRFSTELYQWKRQYAKSVNKKQQLDDHCTAHLQGGNQDNTPEPLSASLQQWLKDLKHLKGVPFNYLVPDQELLPTESIRFFQLDRLWMEALLDGAFSVGRVISKDHVLDTSIATDEVALTASPISGFILRSEVVAGWPGLQVEGYQATPSDSNEAAIPDSEKITLLYRKNLSENVLLCLFEGDLQTLDLHLKPEVLHFGLNVKPDGISYEKQLRDTNGQENSSDTIDVPVDSNKIVQLDELLSNIKNKYDNSLNDIAWADSPTSVNLALQLLEGVENVRYMTV